MVPFKRFPLSNKILKEESLPIVLGMFPDKLLSLISNVTISEILRKASGIDPENLFSFKFKYCKALLDQEGKDP